MKYVVTWKPGIRQSLQQLYEAASDKEGFLQMIKRVSLELSANPLEAGESRDKGARILFKYPLVLWYRVNERMREVTVLRVRYFGR